MKKYIYAVMFVLTSITIVQAQRMLPKQKGLEVSAGTLSYENPGRNYFLNIGLTVNGKNGNYRLWALEYAHEYYRYKELRIPQETYTGEGSFNFLLLSDTRRNIALNAGFIGMIGYETINRGKQVLYDGAKILDEENFIYGAGGRISVEIYLSDNIILLTQGRIKALWGTDLEQFRPSSGAGLRFNF